MKLLNWVLMINSTLTILLLLFKNCINHIKTSISVTVIIASEPVFVISPHVGSKRNASRLAKTTHKILISVKEVPQ